MPVRTFQSLIAASQPEWDLYTQHEFIQKLGKATLERSCFQHYLKQDYLFLIQFAKAWGLAVYKSGDLNEVREALGSLKAIVDVEIDLHIRYCKDWGVDEKSLIALPEAKANTAYTRYVFEVGQQGTLLDLHVALAPCLVGYGLIANWLNKQPWLNKVNNPYQSWIDMYAGDAFQAAVNNEVVWLNKRLAQIDDERFNQLVTIFKNAARLEADFWQMGLTKAI